MSRRRRPPPATQTDRAAALREFLLGGLRIVYASLRASAVDHTNADDYVAFLFNLADQDLRDYVERSGQRLPRAHEAACLCFEVADARELLTVLRMEANLDLEALPGWVRVCVLGGWGACAFVVIPLDPSAPDWGSA